MIHNYSRILHVFTRKILAPSALMVALLCCALLMAESDNHDEITGQVRVNISPKITFSQVPVSPLTEAGASGYHAAKDALLLIKSLAQTDTALEKTLTQLKDEAVAKKLFGKQGAWRLYIIEERKRALAADLLKDVLYSHVIGAQKVAFKDLVTFDFWRLYLEDAVITYPQRDTLKAQEELNALLGMLATVADKLAAHNEEKLSDDENRYSISRDAFIQAIKEEALAKAEGGIRKAYDQLSLKPLIENYLPALQDVAFTITSGTNENTIHYADEAGKQIDYKRTYSAFKDKVWPDMPDLLSEGQPSQDAPAQVNQAGEESSKADDVDGDHLSTNDMKKLMQKVIAFPPALLEIEEEDLEGISVNCLESSAKNSFLEDLQLDIHCKSIVTELEKTPSATAVIPICCDGHWIACVIFKHKDGAIFEVADAKNIARKDDPAIIKLAHVIEENFKKQDMKVFEPRKDISLEAPQSQKEDKKEDKDKEEKVNYDAPLASFPLEDLPKIEQFFGGKTPNSILVRIHQLKSAAKLRTVGTKIKNCLILYGPPGTGKSTLAQVMARMAGWNVLFISGGAFRNAYQGSSMAILNALFAEAKRHEKTVIIIDEIDGTTSRLDPHSSTQEDNRAVKVLITTLDQYRHDPNLFVICTTNNPEKIDPAILRRFTCIEVPLPNYITRKQILEHYFSKNGIAINNEDANAVSPNFFEALVSATNGFSGDALEDLVSNAVLHAHLGLKPEEKVSIGFWFKGIDTGKSVAQNILGLIENPYIPFIYILGGYAHSEFDKHLYSQYKRLQRLRADIEAREEANDPNNKAFKQSWKQKIKSAILSALSSVWHGVFMGVGSDVYNYKVKPPVINAWNKITAAPAA